MTWTSVLLCRSAGSPWTLPPIQAAVHATMGWFAHTPHAAIVNAPVRPAPTSARRLAVDCRLMTGDLPLLGFGLPVSGPWAATPDMIRRTARRAEELGYA